MYTITEVPGHGIGNDSPHAEIPGVKAVYLSADTKQNAPPDQIMQAVNVCRALDADAVAIESTDHTIIAVLNSYDYTYAAAVCDADVTLPAVARSLQMRILSLFVPDAGPDLLPATIVRTYIGRWERKISIVFGEHYAARLVACLSHEAVPDTATAEAMEAMRRNLSSAIGDCIDLPPVSPG
jgi:hypothetical protein